jgi:hypothetical protein
MPPQEQNKIDVVKDFDGKLLDIVPRKIIAGYLPPICGQHLRLEPRAHQPDPV